MSVARLVAGIAAAAALIFAALWWFARPPAPAAPAGAVEGAVEDGRAATAPLARPASTGQESASAPGGVAPYVPVRASARAQLAIDFERLTLPPRTLERLADGDVAGVAADLRARNDDDATLALRQLGRVCVAGIGSTQLRPADARHWMAAVPDPATLARIDAAVDAQAEWATKFRRGCESAGLLRGGELRAEIEKRVQQCSSRGNPHCRAIAAESAGAARVAMLRGAAALGSVEAQRELLSHLEQESGGTPEQQRAREQEARIWRETLARTDPELRASFLGCYERDCASAARDPEAMRRTLESAARDGSTLALLMLSATERSAVEQGAFDEPGGAATIAFLNPSEQDAYAWRAVSERLAAQGCLGMWPTWASFVGMTAAAERELRPSQLAEARRLAADHWSRYGAPVAAARGCTDD